MNDLDKEQMLKNIDNKLTLGLGLLVYISRLIIIIAGMLVPVSEKETVEIVKECIQGLKELLLKIK